MSVQDDMRTVLPIPDQPRTGLVTYDAKDPETKYPSITPLRPPAGAPNVLLILRDSEDRQSLSVLVAGMERCQYG
jgi:hypothetical protein